mgnify:CR=1 FL=1
MTEQQGRKKREIERRRVENFHINLFLMIMIKYIDNGKDECVSD